MTTNYQFPMFSRLEPRTPWAGGRVTDTDVLTLSEAASMATLHAGQTVSVGDVLRAAGRGEIPLRAIVHSTAKVQKHDGGIYCNQGQENENTVPDGAIVTLPLSACQRLSAAGRASWCTFDGFDMVDGILMRFTIARLADGEPDFETLPDDCRVTGNDVHALADAFKEPAPATEAGAPVVAEPHPAALTTNDIANGFAGLKWRTEAEWKKPLGDKPKWLERCMVTTGVQGVSQSTWNPVLIAAELVTQGHAKPNQARARFQTVYQLKPWFDAWKTYEADNFDTP